jgi:hypothetical protein
LGAREALGVPHSAQRHQEAKMKFMAVALGVVLTVPIAVFAQSPQATSAGVPPGPQRITDVRRALDVVQNARRSVIVVGSSITSRDFASTLIEKARALRTAQNMTPIKVIVELSQQNQKNELLIKLWRSPGVGVRGQRGVQLAVTYVDAINTVISSEMLGLKRRGDIPEMIYLNMPGVAAQNSAVIEQYFLAYPQLWRAK